MLIKEKDFCGFVSGHEKAFEIIFRQYYRTLVSFSMRHGLGQMEAEDVVIEVIHRIWERRRDLSSPAALHSLFFTAVRNRSFNVVRNIRNRERIIGEQKVRNDDEFCEYLMSEEITRLLDEAIETLPLQCRAVVLMMLLGKSTNEIAEHLNISVSSVKTYKSRAIELLKGSLRNYPLLLWVVCFRMNLR